MPATKENMLVTKLGIIETIGDNLDIVELSFQKSGA
jgi:hypothetical protein